VLPSHVHTASGALRGAHSLARGSTDGANALRDVRGRQTAEAHLARTSIKPHTPAFTHHLPCHPSHQVSGSDGVAISGDDILQQSFDHSGNENKWGLMGAVLAYAIMFRCGTLHTAQRAVTCLPT
jgi:hypothetical protein